MDAHPLNPFAVPGLLPPVMTPMRPRVSRPRRWKTNILTKVAAIAIVSLLLGPVAAHADGWPLARVLEVVRQRDAGVQAAHAAGDAGRAQAAQNWAALSPHVTLSTGFTRSDDPAALFSQKLRQGRLTSDDLALDALNHPSPQSALEWGIALDQPLFNGAREIMAPGQAARYGRAATSIERAAIADRLLAAVEAWVDALGAREDVRAAGQALLFADAMRTSAAQRLRMGQVAEVDTLRAAARVADARGRSLGASSRLALMLARLSRLVQAPVAEADLVAADDSIPELPGPAERGELEAAHEQAAAAAAESRQAGLALLPSLNSHAAVAQYRPAGTSGWEQRWMVAVSADLPLFDGARRLNELHAARARAAQADANAQAVERDLKIDLAAARAEAAVAVERRTAARAGRAAAEEALRLAVSRYRAGLLALTDLLAADAEATNARTAEIEATSAVTLAHYRLLHALGALQ